MALETKAIAFGGIGTLVETSELQRAAFNRAFDEAQLGWHWSAEDYRRLLSRSGGRDRLRRYAQRLGADMPDSDIDRLHERKTELFREALAESGSAPRPGVKQLVSEARANGIRLAIASTTSKGNVLEVVESAELDLGAFAVVLHRELVAASKPDPEVYWRCTEALGLPGGAIVAIEDSGTGVAAASAAGVPVIAFPGANTRAQDYSAAAAVVDSSKPSSRSTPLTLELCEEILARPESRLSAAG